MKKILIWMWAALLCSSMVLTSCREDQPVQPSDSWTEGLPVVTPMELFTTQQVPVNRGGTMDGTVTLRFYPEKPSVAYISVADFQQLMLPGTTIIVEKTGDTTYKLSAPKGTALVNTGTEVFTSEYFYEFTNLMTLLQEGMDNEYYDGAPFVRYSSVEKVPSWAIVTFDFSKYGIDLKGDDRAVYFPFTTLVDIYSDLYYHFAAYNGEKVVVVNENTNSSLLGLDPEFAIKPYEAESRSADMAAYSYGELCFVIDHFYGMSGRSPIEGMIKTSGLDVALDNTPMGKELKELLKSTDMQSYVYGLDCLNAMLNDGGHTMLSPHLQLLSAGKVESEEFFSIINEQAQLHPEMGTMVMDGLKQELTKTVKQMSLKETRASMTNTVQNYYKAGNTAFFVYNQFGPTNYTAWNNYYAGGAWPSLMTPDANDLSAIVDALRMASADPEVENFVFDLTTNVGGSLDIVMAVTSFIGNQSSIFCENTLTGQKKKVVYEVDRNFDGRFDEKDQAVSFPLHFAVLTTDFAFSCGNLLPSLMKDMGFLVMGEKSGGGACAVQNHSTAEGLQYQISSCRARLANSEWIGIDGGVEPDVPIEVGPSQGTEALFSPIEIGDYSNFYNPAVISEIVTQFYQNK